MFDVGLGTAILLRFESVGGPVTVLCDGGEKLNDRVHKAVRDRLGAGARIDLIIATHYDADHLDGLVPIILDQSIDIGEVWLPPVADDTIEDTHARGLRLEDFLGHRMEQAEGREISVRYTQRKYSDILQLDTLEAAIVSKDGHRLELRPSEPTGEYDRSFFNNYWQPYSVRSGSLGCEHCPDLPIDDARRSDHDWTFDKLRAGWRLIREPSSFGGQKLAAAVTWLREYGHHEDIMLNFERLRAGVAKDAINVLSLQDVIDATKSRDIRVRFECIEEGEPVRYSWSPSDRRFTIPKTNAGGPSLTLMGPSEALIERQRDHLPVAQATFFAMARWENVPTLTASNQLSYVMRFDSEEQSILICGDAAFADFGPFRSRKRNYHPKLVDAMRNLNVLQVAHHGGLSGHFYRVIDKAGIADFEGPLYLLLSHEKNSKVRPSRAFASYMARLGSAHAARLLFTNPPASANTADYKALAAPPTPGGAAHHGDVQLRFDGLTWIVDQHLVAI